MDDVRHAKLIAINDMIKRIDEEINLFGIRNIVFKVKIPGFENQRSDTIVRVAISSIKDKIPGKKTSKTVQDAFKCYDIDNRSYQVRVVKREEHNRIEYYKIELTNTPIRKASKKKPGSTSKKIKTRRKTKNEKLVLKFLTVLGSLELTKLEKLLPANADIIKLTARMQKHNYIELKDGIISKKSS